MNDLISSPKWEAQSVNGLSQPILTKPLATGPFWNLEPWSLIVAGVTGKEGETEGEAMALDELLEVTPVVAPVGAIGRGDLRGGGGEGKEARDLLTATKG